MIRVIEYCLIFIMIVMLQVLLFDNLHISVYAFVNITALFVVILPLEMEKWAILFLSAFLGVVLDSITGASGVNTITLTFLGYIRPFMVDLFIGKKEENKRGVITAKKVGADRYLIFTFALLLLQNSAIFMLESLSSVAIHITIIRILSTTICSLFFLYLIHLPLYSGAEYNQ